MSFVPLPESLVEKARQAGYGEPLWTPSPRQREALLRKEFEVMFGGVRGGGKGLILNDLALTPRGFIEMRDVRVGTVLCDPILGGMTSVIGVYPQGDRLTYRFTFSDGATCTVDDQHLWLGRWSNRTLKKDTGLVLSEAERLDIRYKVHSTTQILDRWHDYEDAEPDSCAPRFMIPLTQPVAFSPGRSANCVTVDPYILGLLLGDGCLRGGTISFASLDDEIIQAFKDANYGEVRPDGKCSYRIVYSRDCRDSLAALGVYGKLANEKFVPDCYKHGTLEVRWGILRGLMDTDGYADSRGHASFTSVSARLAQDVQWIARSLGYKASIKIGPAGYKDRDGEYVPCQDVYTVYISGPRMQDLFLLARKRERCVEVLDNSQATHRFLVDVEPLGRQETVCIAVDSPAQCFITNDFIVTHNSACGIYWLITGNPYVPVKDKKPWDWTYTAHPNYRALVLRKNQSDLEDWVRKARDLYGQLGADFQARPTQFVWAHPDNPKEPGATIVIGHLADSDAYEKYQGQEFQRLLLEEATQIPSYDLYSRVLASVRSVYTELRPQVFLTCNPGGPGHGWVKERFITPRRPDGTTYKPGETIDWDQTGNLKSFSRVFIPAKAQDNLVMMEKDPLYLERLTATLSPQMRKAWVEGDWDAVGGQYFEEFRAKGPLPGEPVNANHVIAPVDQRSWWFRWAACDWGYQHESALLVACQHPNGQVHVYKELVASHMTPAEWGAACARTLLPELESAPDQSLTIWLSHDAFQQRTDERTLADQMAKGIEMVLGPDSVYIPDLAGTNDFFSRRELQSKARIVIKRAQRHRVAGWQYMRQLMRWVSPIEDTKFDPEYALSLVKDGDTTKYQEYLRTWESKRRVLPVLQIWDTCPRLIEALPKLMCADPDKAGDPNDADKTWFSGNDVCFVAGTQVLTQRGEVSIEDVTLSDMVPTRKGLRRVVAVSNTRDCAPVYEVRMSNGRVLVGTSNHPVWVLGTGWKALRSLKQGDILLTWTPDKSLDALDCLERKCAGIEEWPIIDHPPVNATLGANISAPTTERAIGRFMSYFGKKRTALYPQDMSFITSTGILSTIGQRISGVWRKVRTYLYTCANVLNPQNGEKSLDCAVNKTLESCWPGTSPLPELLTTNNWASSTANAYVITPRSQPSACTVDLPLRRDLSDLQSIAPIAVSNPSIVSSENLSDGIRVVQVTPAGSRPVYNLTVDDVHEYFAEGVLVANCDSARYLLMAHQEYSESTQPFQEFFQTRMEQVRPGDGNAMVWAARKAEADYGKREDGVLTIGSGARALRRVM